MPPIRVFGAAWRPWALGLAGVSALSSACEAPDLRNLWSERYKCECEYTVRTPVCITTSGSDGVARSRTCTYGPLMGPPARDPGGEPFGDGEGSAYAAGGTTRPVESRERAHIFACTDFATEDATEICKQACTAYIADEAIDPMAVPPPEEVDPSNPPSPRPLRGTEQVRSADHQGAARCDQGGPTDTLLVWPDVPSDAVRNGVLDEARSTIDVAVEGMGEQTGVHPQGWDPETAEPTSVISIQAGACDQSPSCPLSLRSMRVVTPEIEAGEHRVDNFTLAFAGRPEGGSEGTVTIDPVSRPDSWALRDTSWVPLEVTAVVDGELPMSGEANWGIGTAMETAPRGAISLRRGGEQFMEVNGLIHYPLSVGDEVRDISVATNLRFVFYGGAPQPRARVTMTLRSPDEVVLDATETSDELGGLPDVDLRQDFQWLAPIDGHLQLIALGARAQLHRSEMSVLLSGTDTLCLRVYDRDGNYATRCFEPQIEKAPPLEEEPTCADVAGSSTASRMFNALVDASGSREMLTQLGEQGGTLVVPSDAALSREPDYTKLLGDAEQALKFVKRHVFTRLVTSKELLKLLRQPGTIAIPDRPCGPKGTLHSAESTVPAS